MTAPRLRAAGNGGQQPALLRQGGGAFDTRRLQVRGTSSAPIALHAGRVNPHVGQASLNHARGRYSTAPHQAVTKGRRLRSRRCLSSYLQSRSSSSVSALTPRTLAAAPVDGSSRGSSQTLRERGLARAEKHVLSGRMRLILVEHDITLVTGEVAEFDTRLP